jgi:hypothetical protein
LSTTEALASSDDQHSDLRLIRLADGRNDLTLLASGRAQVEDKNLILRVVDALFYRGLEDHQFLFAQLGDEDRELCVVTMLHTAREHLITPLVVRDVVGNEVAPTPDPLGEFEPSEALVFGVMIRSGNSNHLKR